MKLSRNGFNFDCGFSQFPTWMTASGCHWLHQQPIVDWNTNSAGNSTVGCQMQVDKILCKTYLVKTLPWTFHFSRVSASGSLCYCFKIEVEELVFCCFIIPHSDPFYNPSKKPTVVFFEILMKIFNIICKKNKAQDYFNTCFIISSEKTTLTHRNCLLSQCKRTKLNSLNCFLYC